MEQSFLTYANLAAASGATAAQIEQWVTRGHFKPENATVPGRARRFTSNDVTRVAIMHYVVTRCRLPIPVGARLTEMLHRQAYFVVQLRVYEVDQFAIVYPEAADEVGAAFDEAFVKAIDLASSLDGVLQVLRRKNTVGATILNLSAIARQAEQRLMAALEDE